MKELLLFLTLFHSVISFGQDSTDIDSFQIRIQQFNDSITSIIEAYADEDVDFIAMRSSVKHGHNCFLFVKKDTCTRMSILHHTEDKLIGYISVGNVLFRHKRGKRPCYDDMDVIYQRLTRNEDKYFTNQKPDFSQYDSEKIIILGKVNGRYLNEIVDREYFSTHHSGMIHHAFSHYF